MSQMADFVLSSDSVRSDWHSFSLPFMAVSWNQRRI